MKQLLLDISTCFVIFFGDPRFFRVHFPRPGGLSSGQGAPLGSEKVPILAAEGCADHDRGKRRCIFCFVLYKLVVFEVSTYISHFFLPFCGDIGTVGNMAHQKSNVDGGLLFVSLGMALSHRPGYGFQKSLKSTWL